MSSRKGSAKKAADLKAVKAEGDLRKAAVEALKRAGLPRDLIERTKDIPGAAPDPRYRKAFENLSVSDRLTLRKAFRKFADFPVGEFDKLTGAGAGDGENGRPTQTGQLIAIAEAGCTLFRCGDDAFAEIERDDHRETWPVRSRGFRQWLQFRHLDEHDGAPNNEALLAAIQTIKAKARFRAPEREVYRRVGEADGSLYLDLGDPAWRAVKVDAKGWRVDPRPAALFVRSRSARALPEPRSGRDGIDALRPFLNLNEEDFILAVAWLLAAYRDKGPYPVLVLTGEQGAAKSTCARMLRALVDPSEAPLRSVPRNEHELFIATRNAHVLALDNLSGIAAWLSDALCRLSTGGGYAARELYSDDEEVVINAERPLILNGIDEVVARGDLADRAIFLTLHAIPDADRKPEAELWEKFEEARPHILGALLDALAEGLKRHPSVRLDELPRMADFAKWAVACEPAIFESGAFMQAYTGNRAEAVEAVIDASPVASMIRALMHDREPWEGTSAELLAELERIAPQSVREGKEWPADAARLGRKVNRLKSALRPVGIVLERKKLGGGRRHIFISRDPDKHRNLPPVPPVPPVPPQAAAHIAPDGGGKGGNSRYLSGNGKEAPADPGRTGRTPAPLTPGERSANDYQRKKDGE